MLSATAAAQRTGAIGESHIDGAPSKEAIAAASLSDIEAGTGKPTPVAAPGYR